MSGYISSKTPITGNTLISSILLSSMIISALGVESGVYLITHATFYSGLPLFIGWIVLVDVLFLLLTNCWRIAEIYFWLHIERRLSVALGERQANASFSPVPVQFPISVPLRIMAHFQLIYICSIAIYSLGYIIPFLGFIMQGLIWNVSISTLLPALVFIIAIYIVITGLIIFPYSIGRYIIEATDNGLRFGRGKMMEWEEVRLFTCVRRGKLIRNESVVYLLSSQSEMITWTWYLHPQSPFTKIKPMVPVEEYHRQMQSLSDLVVAKTGLPLLDLSQPVEGELPLWS